MFLSYGWILLGRACAVRPFGDAWRMAVTSPERKGHPLPTFLRSTLRSISFIFLVSGFLVSSFHASHSSTALVVQCRRPLHLDCLPHHVTPSVYFAPITTRHRLRTLENTGDHHNEALLPLQPRPAGPDHHGPGHLHRLGPRQQVLLREWHPVLHQGRRLPVDLRRSPAGQDPVRPRRLAHAGPRRQHNPRLSRRCLKGPQRLHDCLF